jgi:hypothetical protein
MPSGTGLRIVNNFLNVTNGDTYIPPQRGVFTITESFENSGPEAVTIEAVTILSPQERTEETQGEPLSPLTPAGTVHWRDEDAGPGLTPPASGVSVAFTHWVAVPFQVPLLLKQPVPAGQQPADAFVCPST